VSVLPDSAFEVSRRQDKIGRKHENQYVDRDPKFTRCLTKTRFTWALGQLGRILIRPFKEFAISGEFWYE
jgi:hypothetical protein